MAADYPIGRAEVSMQWRNRVRATRILRAISQVDLAQRAGVSRMTLRQIERDDGYAPKGAVMIRLANALNDLSLFWMERTGDEAVS